MCLGDDRRRSQRTQHGSDTVETMQETEQFIRIGHIANPGIPGRVFKAIAEPGEDKRDDQHRIRRMDRVDDVGDEMAARGEDSDTALAEVVVDVVVEQGSEDVADQGGEEDEGDDGISEAVV